MFGRVGPLRAAAHGEDAKPHTWKSGALSTTEHHEAGAMRTDRTVLLVTSTSLGIDSLM